MDSISQQELGPTQLQKQLSRDYQNVIRKKSKEDISHEIKSLNELAEEHRRIKEKKERVPQPREVIDYSVVLQQLLG